MNSLYQVTDALLIWQTVGCLIGLCVSVLLIELVRASWGFAPQRRPGILLSVALLVWNLGGLSNALLIIVGHGYLSVPAKMVCAFGYSGLTLLTWAVLSVWKLSVVGRWRKRLLAVMEIAAVVLGVLLTVWLWLDAMGRTALLSRTGLRIAAETNLFVMTFLGILLALSRRPAWTTRLCSGLTAFGAIGPVAAACLIPVYGQLPQAARVALSVYAEQSVNYVAVAAFLLLARLRYADILVQRALRCVVGILVGLAVWYAVRGSVSVLPGNAHVPAVLALTAGVLVATSMLMTPQLNSGIRRLTEKVFQTPDFDAKLGELSESLQQTTRPEEVFARAENLLHELLECVVAQIAEATSSPIEVLGSLAHEDVVEFPPASCALRMLGMEADAVVAVRQGGQLTYVLVLGRSTDHRGFLASEVWFLRQLAQLVAAQLNVIRTEREKSEQERREALLLHQTTEAELRALRAQLNPHFLFNALNTIADLIVVDARKAEEMTERLADVFRFVLTHSQKLMITVGEEIDFVRRYLEIEETRFQNRLQVCIHVDPAIQQRLIPSMILQPLVENAIKHGLAPKLEGGQLTIRVGCADQDLLLTVEDDGLGFSDSEVPSRKSYLHSPSNGNVKVVSTGVGLANTSQRLRTIYGESANLIIESPQPHGCRVTIRIPA
jgi:two-component system LytT family sensor kinase